MAREGVGLGQAVADRAVAVDDPDVGRRAAPASRRGRSRRRPRACRRARGRARRAAGAGAGRTRRWRRSRRRRPRSRCRRRATASSARQTRSGLRPPGASAVRLGGDLGVARRVARAQRLVPGRPRRRAVPEATRARPRRKSSGAPGTASAGRRFLRDLGPAAIRRDEDGAGGRCGGRSRGGSRRARRPGSRGRPRAAPPSSCGAAAGGRPRPAGPGPCRRGRPARPAPGPRRPGRPPRSRSAGPASRRAAPGARRGREAPPRDGRGPRPAAGAGTAGALPPARAATPSKSRRRWRPTYHCRARSPRLRRPRPRLGAVPLAHERLGVEQVHRALEEDRAGHAVAREAEGLVEGRSEVAHARDGGSPTSRADRRAPSGRRPGAPRGRGAASRWRRPAAPAATAPSARS